MDCVCHDLEKGVKGGLEKLLPGFDPATECVTVISPHDDDALLGAGYLIRACVELGVAVKILVLCDGRAGYSKVSDKPGIVERRKGESIEAYQCLGVPADDLAWLDLPDFSALHYLGWELPGGASGAFGRIVPLLRQWKATRLLIPNGHREHIDHLAGYLAGVFFGPQSGDAVVAEWGAAPPVRSSLVYSVWADFAPVGGRTLRADRALVASAETEELVMQALAKFESQADVIAGLVEARKGRVRDGRALELYAMIDSRPRLDYGPYWQAIVKD